ncbi:GTPase HflX [Blastomonas marina]|uniref:GTPase HflX n=1 Tax=Blastomonas marina TaxID=1867408 RepID=A0ABQ1F8Y7_9SPHN|nr:GTPase HflX [Blastomonas marina]GGA03881.1 GTPase HflX [Blastomonas marina]
MTRGARALIVHPDLPDKRHLDLEARLEEARGLALAIGLVIAESYALPIREPKPATLFGSGQVERIATDCELHEAELVVVDGQLSAIQQRNLEDKIGRKVIDRTGLILEIFGERAATAEGRLQVELAHLDYQQGRLVRSWTHLERQRGGFGFLGGPGETQIEADRRMIRQRMGRLRKELEQVRKTRGLHRERRERAPWPVVALVGYTNAGKSTLFNRLTGADVMAEDLLFATLDPTMRAIALPGVDKAILSDTVGFISDLPTQLVAAFRATLEEVTAADVIVHVRDIANPDTEEQRERVIDVLRGMDLVDEEGAPAGAPIVEAWNKVDLLDEEAQAALRNRIAARDEPIVLLSAQTGEGIETLLDTIDALLTADARVHEITLAAGEGQKLAWLHAHGEVLSQEEVAGDQPGYRLSVRLTEREFGRFSTL